MRLQPGTHFINEKFSIVNIKPSGHLLLTQELFQWQPVLSFILRFPDKKRTAVLTTNPLFHVFSVFQENIFF